MFMLPMILISTTILAIIAAIIYAILRITRKNNGQDYEGESPYKKLFYAFLAILAVILVFFLIGFNVDSGCYGFPLFGTVASIISPIIFLLMFLGFFIILILIGRFVYYDAKSRGMDPWLWLLVVIFVPNFIGLIIYLIVRSYNTNDTNTYNKRCSKCGSSVREDYNICPNCGENLKKKCEYCGQVVDENWNICPHCGNNLSK
ncbi:zinc ribbon domain-containing protein [Clostridium cochlearium]|uniref:Double zinc ribbon n=2 Tax=Clostridium cochlearium TaxID=1494 RepID=A0ABY0QL50_CLOCO|nr:zinc ribbon domain-containing protein [Clostridium cochlearium]MBV1821274.1 zinc ribbon domain-containing protein [Bacteroidales bacterium MSK.15.36]MCG4572213.1 zinc ribbon domain-containing protein [Clostridium cochlearium]MCR1971889.1 zinc ribbon domain-containing protein [Clostridium cochlearium]NME95216.1 hypothetical protein [Clostridium cochlearium]SDL11538.1 Double zinc ribbon [Clostridium cochlearium]